MTETAAEAAEALPVTVIGGYLGAGKTTLVNHLLRHANGLRLAVLVNEFGELPIDADLIESQDDNVIAIAGGCVCCSYGNDLIMAMLELAKMEPRPERVLLEASGVALPGAIAASVGLLQQYRLDGVVVLADAETVRNRADDPYMGDTVVRQLGDADLIVVNKVDLVSERTRSLIGDWLAEHFPNARCIATAHAALPLDIALGPIQTDRRPAHRDTAHHASEFTTLSFLLDNPLDPQRLAEGLVEDTVGILRAKGFARSFDGKTFEVQVVGNRSAVTPSTTSKAIGIVCIGLGSRIDQTRIERAIAVAETDKRAAP